MTERDLTKYFHPRPFVGNNIEYRIGSSASLARFKESQTYLLNQLAFNPFHKFSNSAKEMLLLRYDVCFDLLCEIEQYILVEQDNLNICDIEQLVNKREDYYHATMREQDGQINQEYFEFWVEIHNLVVSQYRGTLKEIVEADMNLSSIFGSIVDLFIQVMNHTLYELQEIDIIFFTKKTPAFNLDPISCNVHIRSEHTNGTCPMAERVKMMRTKRDFDHIIIKNYLDDSVPFKLTPLYEELKKMGVKYNLV